MDVIGIVQTDLNEFNILFDNKNQDKDKQGDQSDANLFSFLGDDDNQGKGNQSKGKQNQNDQLQEMVVRIKGIPEGQKATFLQMYQIIQDAKDKQELSDRLTIVSDGDEQQQQGHNSSRNH